MRPQSLFTVLARALTAGDQDAAGTIRRVKDAVGKRGLPGIVRRYLAAFAGKIRPRLRDVETFLLADRGFPHVHNKAAKAIHIQNWLTEPQQMQPVPAAREWPVPAIASVGELAAWLRLTPEELAWFADEKALNRKSGPGLLHHYYYRLVAKRSGDYRLIEAPKQHLKLLQR
jgi:RNA-directed DNA polymerase